MSRMQSRELTPVSLGTMIRDVQRASYPSDSRETRIQRGPSYSELYRGTEYETRTYVAPAPTTVSRGRIFVLMGFALTVFIAALLIEGSAS